MAGTSWPALTGGTKARGSYVESKFDWIEGSIVPMTGGDKTNGVYDLGETGARWNIGYINTVVSNTVSAADFYVSSATSRYLTLSPANFNPKDYGDAVSAQDYAVVMGISTTEQLFFAGVNLPHNSVITAMKTWWNSGVLGDTGTATLMKYVLGTITGSAIGVCTMTSNGGIHAIEKTDLTNATIDNQNNHYAMKISMQQGGVPYGQQFRGALITYTITRPLP